MERAAASGGERSRKVRVIAVMVWLAVVAGAAGVVSASQDSARRELERRFRLRATIAAQFVQSYVENTFREQEQQAMALLSGPVPTDEEFRLITLSLGYTAAVLLDGQGRVLNVAPARPALVGEDLTSAYEHLRQAVGGQYAISAVVPSAAEGVPIVAFAVPFDTPAGRRVFSGGFDVSRSPLAAFLKSSIPFPMAHADLIDASSAVIASAHTSGFAEVPEEHGAQLAEGVHDRADGHVEVGGAAWYVASSPVDGTRWRVVLAVPAEALYAPLAGQHDTVWLLVLGLAGGGLGVVVLVVRLSDATRSRRRAAAEISARKEVEQQLTVARDAALHAAEMQSQLVANTSHEIRTPLTVILGMNELLLDTDLDATQRRFAERVERAAAGLLSVVNDLLDFAKIDAAGVSLEVTDFDIRSVVDEVVALLHNDAQVKGVALLHVCEPGVAHVVGGDQRRLQQILINLVSNAIKFTDAGTVEIVARPSVGGRKNVVRFEVVDTGIGIAASDQVRLFQPFVQVDGSSTRRHGGTGLGLAISAQLAMAMNSTIVVESSPGVGSMFWFEVAFQPPSHSCRLVAAAGREDG